MMIRSRHTIIKAMTSVMLLVACSSDEALLQSDASRTPISITSSIATTQVKTRGITQDEQLLSGEKVLIWAHQMQTPDAGTTWNTDWTQGAYINAWQLTADGSGNFNGTTYYYPENPLTLMAVHGNIASPAITAGTTTIPATITHTVAADQSALADYAKSDLTYWAGDNSGNGYRSSSPTIAMQMGHKLSKIEITLATEGSDYTAEELANATVQLSAILPSVTMNMSSASSGAISAASGSATAITPHPASALSYEAIIPPQDKSIGVISITLNGYTVPVTPAQPATSFEANTRYQYTITLKNQQATVQSSITAWGDGIAEGDQAIGTKAIPNYDIRKLPLWYVAEKNVDYTAVDGTKTWDSGSGTFSFATGDDAGYFFTWADAMKFFTTTANATAATATSITSYTNGSGSKIKGWHLPINTEWRAIVPRTGDLNMFNYNTSGADGVYMSLDKNFVWGYNAATKAAINPDNCYWYRIDDGSYIKIIYALRFLGTEYCSVWKYELRNAAPGAWSSSDKGCFTITARLVDNAVLTTAANFTDETRAEAVCREYIKKHSWVSHFAGLSFTNGNDEAHGAVQRVFSAVGWVDYNVYEGSTSIPTNDLGTSASFHMSTDNEANTTLAWRMYFDDDEAYLGSSNKRFGRPVRLFRDSYDYVAPKTTIATATTSNLAIGDIVCSDGTIYAAANATYVATAHKTPIGIIAYVNDGSAIGDAATEKGLGRFPTKSQGRALVMCLKNSSNGAKWRATNTAFGTSYTSTDASYTTTTFYPGWQRTHDMNSTEFPAAYSAYNFTALTAPSNTTGWFLPSSGQWKLMISKLTPFQALTQEGSWSYNVNHDYTSQYLASLMDAYLAPAGDYDAIRIVDSTEYFYWTSSEYSSDYGSRIDMPKDGTLGFNMLHAARTYSYYVRPILAF